mmetsp:Transcript_23582/g.23248  ORF Transcript_23582/g.23248 Transcript_23582/m.23248 type:complete len:158 (+) Transcript_23582:706-1179(+)
MANHDGTVRIGNPKAHEDLILPPTVVLNPRLDSDLMKDEIFGPILPVITYKNLDDAIKFVNERPKPLMLYYFGSVFGANRKKIEKNTSSGMMSVNDTLMSALNPEAPFGGVGYSGYGKYHGYEGFKALSNQKPIWLKAQLNFFPSNYVKGPYHAKRI